MECKYIWQKPHYYERIDSDGNLRKSVWWEDKDAYFKRWTNFEETEAVIELLDGTTKIVSITQLIFN